MRIVFRTDASLKIGNGHVMRCLTLAHALQKQGAKVQFICREHEGNLIAQIKSEGFEVFALPLCDYEPFCHTAQLNESPLFHAEWLGSTQAQDAQACLPIVQALNPHWLIVDHYALDKEWEIALSGYYQKLMVIDDLGDREHICHVLLDQNIDAKLEKYRQKVPIECVLLMGTFYALLRPEFAQWRERSLFRRANPVFKELLITMGGVDAENYTGLILESLRTGGLPDDLVITVVIGETAPHYEAVQSLALKMQVRTEVKVNVKNMAELMARADLAIGAAGATTWERCCLGLPTILMVLAPNQVGVGKELAKRGAAFLIHRSDELLPFITSMEIQLLEALSLRSRAITDGLGVLRVVEILKEEFHGN
jgi:UDP-2,4-diacetamido-2,4,6-trideoxy-beta-L-altropyranose hydrolase